MQAFLLLVFLGLVSQSEQGSKLLLPLILLASFWFFSFLLLRHQSKLFAAISKGYKATISGFILYKPKISQLVIKILGIFLIIIGIICGYTALNMDTSIETSFGHRVNNFGLMNQQTNFLIGAWHCVYFRNNAYWNQR